MTGVSFWLYTTRVTTNRSFVALYNVNLGVLFNLFFHAFANLFTANITLCVLLRPQQEKKKKKTTQKWIPLSFVRQPSLYFAIVFIRDFVFILLSPFFLPQIPLYSQPVLCNCFSVVDLLKRKVRLIRQVRLRSIVLQRDLIGCIENKSCFVRPPMAAANSLTPALTVFLILRCSDTSDEI